MEESIYIKGLTMQFITSKQDNYGNTICYFKDMDSFSKEKLKIVRKMSDTLYKPFWKTDKKEMMLKVKETKVYRKDLVKQSLYELDIELTPFFTEKDGKELKGYTAKVLRALDVKNDGIESDEDED